MLGLLVAVVLLLVPSCGRDLSYGLEHALHVIDRLVVTVDGAKVAIRVRNEIGNSIGSVFVLDTQAGSLLDAGCGSPCDWDASCRWLAIGASGQDGSWRLEVTDLSKRVVVPNSTYEPRTGRTPDRWTAAWSPDLPQLAFSRPHGGRWEEIGRASCRERV